MLEAHTSNHSKMAFESSSITHRRNMTAEDTPEQLWDRCLVAYSQSSSALSIRELNGAVPATLMTGDTLDISILRSLDGTSGFGIYRLRMQA
jgi:hypothetical protein